MRRCCFSALRSRTEAFCFGIIYRPQGCPFGKMKLVRTWRFISPPSWRRVTYLFSGEELKQVLKASEGELLSEPRRPWLSEKRRSGGDVSWSRKQLLITSICPVYPWGISLRSATAADAAVLRCSLYVAVEPSSASGHQKRQSQARGQTPVAVLLQGYTVERLQITILSTKSVRPSFQKQDSLYDGILNNRGRSFRSFYEGVQC